MATEIGRLKRDAFGAVELVVPAVFHSGGIEDFYSTLAAGGPEIIEIILPGLRALEEQAFFKYDPDGLAIVNIKAIDYHRRRPRFEFPADIGEGAWLFPRRHDRRDGAEKEEQPQDRLGAPPTARRRRATVGLDDYA